MPRSDMHPSFPERARHFVTLVLFEALAALRTERQRTYLGFLWWFFEPLFLMLVFYVVFGVFMQRGGPDYLPVLLCGLVLWQWFGNSIMHCAMSIQSALPLLCSVRVEPAVFPLATFVADSVKCMLVFVVLGVVLVFMGYAPTIEWLALIPVLFVEGVLGCGACLIVAALVPFVPDLRFVISPLLRGMFFVSGVFFTIESISPKARHWLEWNPMAVLIDCGRNVLLYSQLPDPARLGRVLLIALLAVVVGTLLLHRFSHRYPKLAG